MTKMAQIRKYRKTAGLQEAGLQLVPDQKEGQMWAEEQSRTLGRVRCESRGGLGSILREVKQSVDGFAWRNGLRMAERERDRTARGSRLAYREQQ